MTVWNIIWRNDLQLRELYQNWYKHNSLHFLYVNPVYVVSIAGPYGKGKSEGIDAVMGEGLNDNQIFTFIVLLASVLIDNSMGVPTRYNLNGLEYPSPSTSDSRDGEMSGGERKSINEAYFYVYLKACISEIQERYFNGFNAYSKRKFHMDVNFTLKRFLKSTWKTCVNGFGCAKCSYMFFN